MSKVQIALCQTSQMKVWRVDDESDEPLIGLFWPSYHKVTVILWGLLSLLVELVQWVCLTHLSIKLTVKHIFNMFAILCCGENVGRCQLVLCDRLKDLRPSWKWRRSTLRWVKVLVWHHRVTIWGAPCSQKTKKKFRACIEILGDTFTTFCLQMSSWRFRDKRHLQSVQWRTEETSARVTRGTAWTVVNDWLMLHCEMSHDWSPWSCIRHKKCLRVNLLCHDEYQRQIEKYSVLLKKAHCKNLRVHHESTEEVRH